MNYRISAGAIVTRTDDTHGQQVLLVNYKNGAHDFWVAPGGGVNLSETLEEAAAREAWEETGTRVAIGKLACIEDLYDAHTRTIKFWFAATWLSGDLDWSHPEAQVEQIAQAAWLPRAELAQRVVFPPVLAGPFWDALAAGLPQPLRLAPRELLF